MGPWALFRKTMKILRGGATSRDVALGVLLGFLWGMIPGFNLTVFIIVLLLLILNANVPSAVFALALGKLISITGAPLCYELGFFLIHKAGFAPLVRSVCDTPVLAFLDFQIYCVFAGLIFGLIVGGVLAIIAGLFIRSLRKGLMAMSAKGGVQKVSSNIFTRIVLRIVFGKQKATLAEALAKKSPILRKKGLIFVVIVVVIFGGGIWVASSQDYTSILADQLGKANGAEVNIRATSFSLLRGRFEINGLQVTDPKTATNNSFQAETIVLDVSMSDLLAKRLVVDLIQCDRLQLNEKRDKPGEVYPSKEEAPPSPPQFDLNKLIPANLEYVNKVKELNEYLEKLKEYMDDKEEQPQEVSLEDEHAKQLELAKLKGYQKLSADDILRERAAWAIVKIKAETILIADFPPVIILGKNISSNRKLWGKEPKVWAEQDKEALAEYLKKSLTGEGDSPLDGVSELLGGKKDDGKKDEKKGGGLLDGLLGK
ncbi:MAG: DUF2062 domain-containing protein [Phycisphaerae bacterium]|nr:DUF2062 domain-containing protein [Phycisphaerae bacterium]